MVEFGGKKATVPVKVKDASKDRADQLQARRDADLHAGRLQHRRLPRRGPRQGRLPPVAVRLRRRRRPLPPDARDARPAHQPGACRTRACSSKRRLGKVPHTGGQRSRRVTSYHKDLIRWIEARRRTIRRRSPRRCRWRSIPKHAVLDGKGETQQMIVRAKYSDGTDRDVTSLALFLSNNDNSAKISADGARHRRRARRGVRHGPLRHLHRRLAGDRPAQGAEVRLAERARRTTTSTRSSTKAQEAADRSRRRCATTRSSSAASTSTSSACCRRRRSMREFVGSKDAKKREKLVDELLGRKEFAELWVMKWAELLQIRSSQSGQLQGDAPLLQLAAGQDRQQRADERVGAGTARRLRRHLQEPGDELLPERDATS